MVAVPLKMLPYPVHAHRYADTKLPHSIEAHDDLDVAIAKAEAHSNDPTVADILLVSVHRQLAVVLKGGAWVFGDTMKGHFDGFALREVQDHVAAKGIRAVLDELAAELRAFSDLPYRPAA